MKELTLAELGRRMGVSRERARQLYASGKLTHAPRKMKLGKSYLLLFPAETQRRKMKNGRPRKPIDTVKTTQ